MANTKGVIYVAGPYRARTAWGIEQNIREAEEVSLELWGRGYAVICPHANTRFFQGELEDRVWLDGDLDIVAKCDGVFMMPDWRKSTGAREEHVFAALQGIPIFTSYNELEEHFADV